MNLQREYHGTEGHHANSNTKAQQDNGTWFPSLAVAGKVGILKRESRIVASRSYWEKGERIEGLKKCFQDTVRGNKFYNRVAVVYNNVIFIYEE